jgi:hypothetical protein
MVKPEELTEELIVKAMCDKSPAYYADFGDFAYDCHSVSWSLIRSGLLGEGGPSLRVARGACLGVGGQHSWVVMGHPYDDQAIIVDLTLWSYNPDQPRIWLGSMQSSLHRPKGYQWIYDGPRPQSGGEEPVVLDVRGMSRRSREFLGLIGPLDARGWGALWSHCGMLGWPAKEILEAFLDQHPKMAALVPIDIVGMVTDRNPSGPYW